MAQQINPVSSDSCKLSSGLQTYMLWQEWTTPSTHTHTLNVIIRNTKDKLLVGIMAHTYIPNTQEAKAGELQG